MAGYSSRSLVEKLGIKPDTTIIILNEPVSYANTLGVLPHNVKISSALPIKASFIQVFVTTQLDLKQFSRWIGSLESKGILWVCWPKKTSQIKTDVNENIIRDTGLSLGVVDVKVCAIDNDWSGLKFMWRKDRRTV